MAEVLGSPGSVRGSVLRDARCSGVSPELVEGSEFLF